MAEYCEDIFISEKEQRDSLAAVGWSQVKVRFLNVYFWSGADADDVAETFRVLGEHVAVVRTS